MDVTRRFLNTAVEKLLEVCTSMFGLEVELSGESQPLDTSTYEFGSLLGLMCSEGGGTYELALFGKKDACVEFTRAIFMMEEGDPVSAGEIADALGETTNMVAGLVKNVLQAERHLRLQTGIPVVFQGDDCHKYGPKFITTYSQSVTFGEHSVDIVWCERTPRALFKELDGLLGLVENNEETVHSLADVLAVSEELVDAVADSVPMTEREALAGCAESVMAIINGRSADIPAAIKSIHESTSVLGHNYSLKPGTARKDVPLPQVFTMVEVVRARLAAPLKAYEWPEEDVELATELMSETREGLEQIDDVLMAAEQGTQDSDGVDMMFRVIHSMKGTASFLPLEEMHHLGHVTETLLAQVRDGSRKLEGTVLDAVFESVALIRPMLDYLTEAIEKNTEIRVIGVDAHIKLLELLIEGQAVKDVPRLSQVMEESQSANESGGSNKASKIKETMKIEVEAVEQLEKLVSALSVAEGKLLNGEAQSPDTLAELKDIRRDLQRVTQGMRMIEVQSLFKKMARMVRDLAKQTDKMIRMAPVGEDTKVPRTYLEKLGSPLVHMVRNSVDHGIETKPERSDTGKDRLATIQLKAFHAEDNVVIELSDDGRGIDASKVFSRAVEKGVVEADASLSDEEIYLLIFAPGFSTAEKVTALSGRGVGMDVVKRNIEEMHGSIGITSNLGSGTVFTITIPLQHD